MTRRSPPLLVALAAAALLGFAPAQQDQSPQILIINGQRVESDQAIILPTPTSPAYTAAPLLAEGLGAEFFGNVQGGNVLLQQGARTLALQLFDSAAAALAVSDALTVNGVTATATGAIRQGAIVLLPLRATAEALGATVSYDERNRSYVVVQPRVEIRAVRSNAYGDYDRIVLDLSRDATWRVNVVSGVERPGLVLTMPRAFAGQALAGGVQTGTGFVRRVGFQLLGETLRVTVETDPAFRLAEGDGYRTFALPAETYESGEVRPARIVIDLGPRYRQERPEAAPPPGTGRRVVIDPGHGGSDHGDVSPGGLAEKEIALDVAIRLRDALADSGLQVDLTRTDDRSVPIEERAQAAAGADIFVSIHTAAAAAPGSGGMATYYLGQGSTPSVLDLAIVENGRSILGQTITDAVRRRVILDAVGPPDGGRRLAELVQRSLLGAVGGTDRGVHAAPLYVLSRTPGAAVMLEIGWLADPVDARNLNSPAYRQQIAQALAIAIQQYAAGLQ